MSSGSGSNNSSRLPALVLLAVAVFGPPSVATLTFAHAVTQNPWLTALLVALYEVLVFVLSFVVKVWQKLESPLVDKMAEWLMHWGQGVVSSAERNYCQHIIYEHRVFDVKGLSTQTAHALELEQVFVEVCVDPKAPHQTTANPLALPEALRTGTHEIWDYLAPKSGFNQHLVIIGAPGSGKTTLLKHIALTLVLHRQKQLRQRHGGRIPQLLPILLFLRDHVKSLKENEAFSLIDAIQAHTQREWQQTVPSEWITQRLIGGSCLVLLDGLDEVADPAVRYQMVEWVQRQMQAYGQNRFLLTSRPHGYRDNPIEGVTVTEVRPFTREQVEQFVYNWYHANEMKSWGQDDPGVQMSARKGAQDLLQRLHHAPALLALAVNPLLLTMIATVHRYRSSLPGKRVALYAEICEVFLGKRQEARGVTQELTPAQKQQVLQPLAYHLMQLGARDISLKEACKVITPPLTLVSAMMQPRDFIEMIQNTSGLFLERDPGIYSFAHLTFQEYLAAVHVKETGSEDLLVAQVGVTWWHETIRLYCAQADATNLILACLAGDRPSVSSLTLALDCEQEALKLQTSARTQLKTLLSTGIEDPDPERRGLIGEALLMWRVRQMIHLHDNVYIDTSLVTHAEYQPFLHEQRQQGKFRQPDHWTTYQFPPGQGKTPALGMHRSDALDFCAWLSPREGGIWHYRLPYIKEIKSMDQGIWKGISEQMGYWVEDNERFIWSHVQMPSSLRLLILEVLDRALTRDLALAPDYDLDHDLAFDFSLDRDRIRARDLARDRNLEYARARALDLDLSLALDRAHASNLEYARARARDLARNLERNLERARDRAFDLYLQLLMLRERKAGRLPAWEGILLVKERQQDI